MTCSHAGRSSRIVAESGLPWVWPLSNTAGTPASPSLQLVNFRVAGGAVVVGLSSRVAPGSTISYASSGYVYAP